MYKGTINNTTLLGRLGNDPHISETSEGLLIGKLSVATTDVVKNKASNTFEDETDWHHAVSFGKGAEYLQTYFKKGDLVYIEGKHKPKVWTDNEGNKHYSNDLVIESINLLSAGNKREGVPLNEVEAKA